MTKTDLTVAARKRFAETIATRVHGNCGWPGCQLKYDTPQLDAAEKAVDTMNDPTIESTVAAAMTDSLLEETIREATRRGILGTPTAADGAQMHYRKGPDGPVVWVEPGCDTYGQQLGRVLVRSAELATVDGVTPAKRVKVRRKVAGGSL